MFDFTTSFTGLLSHTAQVQGNRCTRIHLQVDADGCVPIAKTQGDLPKLFKIYAANNKVLLLTYQSE